MTTKQILLTCSAPGIELPSPVRVGQSGISFSSTAGNLGVIFDSELALKEQVNKLCQLAFLEIRRIGPIRQYLSVEATRTLVSSPPVPFRRQELSKSNHYNDCGLKGFLCVWILQR